MSPWATPSAGMHKQDVADDGRYAAYVRDGGFQQMLPTQAKLFAQDATPWPTPTTAPEAPNTNSNQKSSPPWLGGAAAQWAPGVVAPDPWRFPVAPSGPGRVARLKALGNAVIPAAAYWIFCAIAAAEARRAEEAA